MQYKAGASWPGFVPAIHVFSWTSLKTWMPGTRPGMTSAGGLFRRHLARGLEGAGVVDFGDLLIAEAEHLAQDFVRVLA